jgi:hypothetical protein
VRFTGSSSPVSSGRRGHNGAAWPTQKLLRRSDQCVRMMPDVGISGLLTRCRPGLTARQALADLLTYRADYDTTLAATNGPHGLGVAWGESLHPTSTSEIVLCTPDTLPQALQQILT